MVVIPQDKDTALSNIASLLDGYLGLASRQGAISLPGQQLDVSVLHLQATISHLHSQLALAQATVQMQQSSIQMLQLTAESFTNREGNVDRLRLLEGDTMQEGEQSKPSRFSGIITPKKFEGKFFDIDIPKIIAMLKRRR